MTKHAHDWQPIQTWSARYRCSSCGALGWKRIARLYRDATGVLDSANRADVARPTEIVPYVCTHRGCNKDAVTHARKRGQFCREHAK